MVNPKLIIFDVYGTLLKADSRDNMVREGFRELINHYSNSKVVAFSDGDEQIVGSDLESSGLIDAFEIFYSARNCISKYILFITDQTKLHRLGLVNDNNEIKNLEQVCLDYDISIDDAVFIGDNQNGKDEDSAIYYGMKFIHVPQYREKPPNEYAIDNNGKGVFYNPTDFSFELLIDKL